MTLHFSMLLTLSMETKRTFANDNNETWASIGLQADLIVNRLRNEALIRALLDGTNEQQNVERGGNSDRARTEKQKDADEREYVEKRLRDLAAFERRASGK